MIRPFSLALAAVAVVSMAGVGFAAGVDVGEKAPEFKELPTTEGKKISLSDFAESKATVVAFTCNNCPVAVAYQDDFVNFTKEYKDKGVSFVAINVNTGEDLQKMKTRAEEAGFNFPYAYDASQETAKAYGARVTPHLYVLDNNREVVYIGAFDNAQNNASEHYVKTVVDSLLAGEKPQVEGKSAFGCGIQWKR
ncbi:MAG: thioredoxin family protein [Planctomycetes bacterium]|nr:thioredoxin family protein [Planctomycetota bacterium]